MKRKVNFLIFFICSFSMVTVNAQLVNNGGTIIVKDGAVLHVESDVTNTTGSLQLEANSTLEVSGDFVSEAAATFDADANSTVNFFGSTSKNIKSGGDDFGKVLMSKDAGVDMSLTDAMEITTNLDFTPANGNKLVIGANDLTFGTSATVTNNGTNRYIQADAAGVVKKKFTATGTFEFPIGDSDEYSPLTANITSGTFGASANLAVNVVDAVHPNKYSDAESHITRYWKVDATDIASWAATLTGTYTDADIVGTEANIKGASYITDWNFANAGADNATNTVTGDISANSDFTGMNYYGKMASLKAFLQGPFSGGSMTTTLTTLPLGANDGDHFPNISPYGTGETIASIPANVTDWIKIEIRDAADASNILKSYGKFIKNDGQIYELDGTSAPRFKDAPTTGYVAVRHRNHLGIRTNSALDFSTSPSHDFTTASSQAYGTDPMKEVSSGVWGMWSGNTSGDQYIKYNGGSNDRVKVLIKVGFTTPNNILTGYYNEDVNMDKDVKYNGGANDRVKILINVGFSTPNDIITEQL